jgi:hypothetical protein
MWWDICLRHCASCRKVSVSIHDNVTGIFHLHNPSGRTTALGLTPPLTEMSTKNISWGAGECKGGRCVQLTTLLPLYADCFEIWEPQTPGTIRASPGLHRDYFTFTFTLKFKFRINLYTRKV